jgi:acyl phosphate:glycerol-3-phosphate acyltransferase
MGLFWRFIVSFLMGAIPFAKVAMIGTGIDITKVGSKNPGFNNVRRIGKPWRSVFTLIGDISKGYVALLLLGGSWPIGIASVMGHCWSPFLGFNGGKGVATTVGVLLFLEPKITIVCLPLYPILRFFGRKMGWNQEGAISSLTTMLVIAVSVSSLRGPGLGIYAFVLFVIVLIRHIPNLREIMGRKPE